MPERSTKAGARTPATLHSGCLLGAYLSGAQRRPGHAPRRHLLTVPPEWRRPRTLNEGRGTHPGDTCTAGPVPGRAGPRSTKAGARTPATLAPMRAGSASVGRRSTKAGARTPATRHPLPQPGGGRCRSTKAGARTPATPAIGDRRPNSVSHAQRRPGHAPRRHALQRHATPTGPDRSTKAGARTPATRGTSAWRAVSQTALNEGRGTHPGDTRP